jgi:hypothetical protein
MDEKQIFLSLDPFVSHNSESLYRLGLLPFLQPRWLIPILPVCVTRPTRFVDFAALNLTRST